MEIIISIFLLFVGIAILVIIHICIVGRAYRREFFGSDGLPIIKGAGMTKHDLKQLPCFQYKPAADDTTNNNINYSNNNNNNNNNNKPAADDDNSTNKQFECAVCLDTFKLGDDCRMLPNCHHFFHVQCVDEWLIKSPFCPICRTCTIYLATLAPSKAGGGFSGLGFATSPETHTAATYMTGVPSPATYVAADPLC